MKIFQSTEELDKYLEFNNLVGLDSEYSLNTQKLKEKFNARNVHYDFWWIATPTDWICPVCKRIKEKLVKINKHGDLSGHLHEHHDHMADLAKKRFDEISAQQTNVIADNISEKFVKRLAYALASYDNTIICSDCNVADTDAKKIVSAHKDFSFSPTDISKFIIVSANNKHEINHKIAKEMWDIQTINFQERLKLIDSIALIASQNKHWYQPSRSTALQVERISKHYIEAQGLNNLSKNPYSLLYSTNIYKGNKSSWRKDRKLKHVLSPKKGEIQHMINLKSNLWNKVPDNWSCPICNRSKINCIQITNKNEWGFTTGNRHFLDFNCPNWANNLTICNECNTVSKLLQKEIAEKDDFPHYHSYLIEASELKKSISPSNNNKHSINNDYVEKLLIELEERLYSEIYSYSDLS